MDTKECGANVPLNDSLGGTHCRPDYLPWEQRNTCFSCAAPLADNQLVKDALIANNTAAWAKNNLRILADMAEDRGLDSWLVAELRRIGNGVRLLTPNTEAKARAVRTSR